MKHSLTIFLFALAVPFIGHAATLQIMADQPLVDIGQVFHVNVALDTQGDSANAIEGEIDFPAGQFTLEKIDDGASPISFWIVSPAQTASGVVSFSGIVPGGFQGAASSVVSVWLTPTAPGAGLIALNNVEVLKNDGEGSVLSLATSSVSVMVSTSIASTTPRKSLSLIAPEDFTPVISRDPNIYDGKYFLSFSAADKGSGIDHYEVLEGASGWQIATSPYLLKDQSLSSNIYVRAVDHDGNFVVVSVPGTHAGPQKAARVSFDWISIVGCLILLAILWCIMTLSKRKSI